MDIKLKNKGYTIMIDALVALIFLLIIVTAIFSIKYSGTSKTGVMSFRELHYMSEDTLDVLNKKGILDEIATLWAENSTPGSEEMVNASNLAREYLEKMLPPGVGYKLIIEEGVNSFVINSSNESRIPWNDSTTRTHSTRVLVGYGSGLPTFGHVSRASLKSISNKLASDYVYFGGFVGQGNITRFLDLPSDANVTSAYMELNPGADFDLYINGALCGHYTGMGWNLTARSWDLNSSCFSGGRNTININFTENESNFIGGGYIRVDYRTGEWNRTPDLNTYWFPGIKGLINLYSGFYVPGDIQDMNVYLHYRHNISNVSTYLTIANVTVYRSNVTGERNISLDWSNLSASFGGDLALDNAVSKKTVPVKFGTDEFSLVKGKATADAVLITDVSYSMNILDVQPGNQQRLAVAKEVDRRFVNQILSYHGTRVGLTAYSSTPGIVWWHPLSSDNVSLITQINGYVPWNWTCICCGIQNATDILQTQSNKTRKRAMLVMSDGVANIQCAAQGTGNARNDSIKAACKARDLGIDIYSVAFGSSPDRTTLKKIACWNCSTNDWLPGESATNCSRYYESNNADELKEIYREISDLIANASLELQIINITFGTVPLDNIIYPDSYIKLKVGIEPTLKHGETLLTLESLPFGNNISNGTFFVPNKTRPVDAKVISYSGPYWTNFLKINSSNTGGWKEAYNLTDYGSNYKMLGDPYIVNIPIEDVGTGANFVEIRAGGDPSTNAGGSPDNRVVYSVAIRAFTGYTKPKKNTEGCNWTVEFFDDTTENLLVPSGYTGPKNCNYTSTSIVYDNQSSVDVATYRLFSQLDAAPMDGRLDVKFDPEDITIETTTVGGIRSLWGPIRVKLILWM